MTREQFQQIFIEVSSEVADEFHPKNEWVQVAGRSNAGEQVQTERSKRRGEYLRTQAVLCHKLCNLLTEVGILEN